MLRISSVLLSYNRLHLLKKTINSYLDTISVPYELFIVDNASNKETREFIEAICEKFKNVTGIFLTDNIGGRAFNIGMSIAQAPFIHLTENDLEYHKGWANNMLKKFQVFPKLGQLSVFSPQPDNDKGEMWYKVTDVTPLEQDGQKIYIPKQNVGSSCIIRREIFDKGLLWKTKQSADGSFKHPADYQFSMGVKNLGYHVALNDKRVVFNWGHNIQEWMDNVEYYLEGYRSKTKSGEEKMKEILQSWGYDLINDNGKYKIIPPKKHDDSPLF